MMTSDAKTGLSDIDIAKINDETYKFFYTARSPFSQWYKCKFVDPNGISYNCTEQFMMYNKAKLFGDNEVAAEILKTNDQGKIKALGRKVRGFDEVRWKQMRESIVVEGNILKFQQNKPLLDILLATGKKYMVEASPYDTIWGIGMSEDQARITPADQWRGTNLLGKCLDRVRTYLVFQIRMRQKSTGDS